MRSLRVAENIKRTVADIIKQSADPRFTYITVTAAEVTRDLKYATIYYTTMGHPESGKALTKAMGYIKSQLAKKLEIKYLPELIFEEDRSYEYGKHIDAIIDNIKSKKNKERDSETH